MEIIKRIEKWQKERLLDKQEYVWDNEVANIVEELIEAYGYKVPKDKRKNLMKSFKSFIDRFVYENNLEQTTDDDCDHYFDICVFAVGAIMKLGYEPICVFEEGLKEIESRTGSIGKDGKWHKDTSPEAKAKWYKADYSRCKRKD